MSRAQVFLWMLNYLKMGEVTADERQQVLTYQWAETDFNGRFVHENLSKLKTEGNFSKHFSKTACKYLPLKTIWMHSEKTVNVTKIYVLDCKSDKIHTDFLYSLLHYTCSTCFRCYLHPSSGAQTAEYSRWYAWLLWCVGSWKVHLSRLQLGHPHTYSTVNLTMT
jgi:hypothetical protein